MREKYYKNRIVTTHTLAPSLSEKPDKFFEKIMAPKA
jgi:hypothetical protein